MSYPSDLTNLTNPTIMSYMDSPSHSAQHSVVNDAVEALEMKVGITSSSDSNSLDFKLSGVTGTDKAVSKTGIETLTNKTLTSPTITNKNSSGTDNGTETLANKTLTSPTITNKTSTGTDSGTETLTNKTLTSPVINTPTGDVVTITGNQTLTNKTLTSPSITGGALTGTTTIAQPAWTYVSSFENSWVNYEASETNYNHCKYFKDSLGIVHLAGLVKSGTLGQNIFTLPTGYRPLKNYHFAVASNGAFGYCYVVSDGRVQASGGSNTWFDLGTIHFRAEQ